MYSMQKNVIHVQDSKYFTKYKKHSYWLIHSHVAMVKSTCKWHPASH